MASPTEILAVNGVTFLASACLLAGVPMGRRGQAGGDHGETLWSATRSGARAAMQVPGIPALLVIGALSVLGASAMNVAEPLLATGPLGAGKSGYGCLGARAQPRLAIGSFLVTGISNSLIVAPEAGLFLLVASAVPA